MTYSYRRRAIGSCQPKRALRAAETGQNVANAIALYERPKLVHSGPTPMRQGESEEFAYAYPWVRLDTAAGVPTKLAEATVWLTHLKGSLDVSMRLVGCTYAKGLGDVDAASVPSFAPVTITAELLQYVAGSTTPVLLASAELKTTIRCWPVSAVNTAARYPLLYLLGSSWQAGGSGYQANLQSPTNRQRVNQLYPSDLALLQPVRLTIPYGDAGWTPDFETRRDTPCFVRVRCIKDTARDIIWDSNVVASATSPTRDFRTAEFVRIFNIGDVIYDWGRL